jgi:serine/threonine protein kinase/CheY-like chemotaxis protein
MRFLIIDGDARFRRVLHYFLRVHWPDATVEELSPHEWNGGPASLEARRFDAILLDYPIAGERGFEWLRALGEQPSCPPVILFAAQGSEFLAVDALKAGAASYFPKTRLRYKRLIDTIRVEIGAGLPIGTTTRFDYETCLRHSRKYRFVDTLHTGEQSSVYLAKLLNDDSRIAFKVIRHVPDSGRGKVFDRFLQEYELVAAIDHPNVVKIFDLGAYIAMEYLPRGSLAQRIIDPLEPAVAIEYTRQIAASLVAIHGSGILHRDLKPANIMFRDDGSLALIDFGLAKQMELEAAITDAGQIFGTPYYMSPEQGHGQSLDERSDIYSLGCLLYEMLHACRPFVAESAMGVIYKHAHAPRPQLNGKLCGLAEVISKMYAAEPADRYSSAQALLNDLCRFDL